jgi:hypothetical protein
MAKKITNNKKNKRAAKISYLKNKGNIRPKKTAKKLIIKNAKHSSYKAPSNEKMSKKEEQNQDIISKSFFDAQSSIKVKCSFCDKILNNNIKIILEPFPKINIPLKKYSLPFELICLKCLIIKLKNNCREIKSLNFFNESNPHQYTHYRIINKMEEPIFTSDWSFGDEIKLLGALARLGLGNWDEISNITGKGKFECESHYYTFYYKKENDYISKINILNNTINVKNEKYKKELKKNKIEENKLLTKIGNDLGFIPFSSDNNQSNRSININRNNSKSDHPNAILLQNACNTLGYWPKRNEFDVEYKNDAEIELMEIEFKENDSQNINDMYDKILCNYNNILDKRQERKNFVMDKNLFDVKKQVMMEKKLSREDREIYQSVKQNIKYLSNEQFNDYFQGIILEKNIKSRLNQLLYYYNKGYKTYEQILKYIVELKQKSNKIKSKYNPKNHLEQLNISLRESTVKQVNKLNENSEEDKIKVIKNKNLPKSGTKDKILKFYK